MDQLKAEVVEAVAVLELQELEGRKKLPNTPLHALAVVSEYGALQPVLVVSTCGPLLQLSAVSSDTVSYGRGAVRASLQDSTPNAADNLSTVSPIRASIGHRTWPETQFHRRRAWRPPRHCITLAPVAVLPAARRSVFQPSQFQRLRVGLKSNCNHHRPACGSAVSGKIMRTTAMLTRFYCDSPITFDEDRKAGCILSNLLGLGHSIAGQQCRKRLITFGGYFRSEVMKARQTRE